MLANSTNHIRACLFQLGIVGEKKKKKEKLANSFKHPSWTGACAGAILFLHHKPIPPKSVLAVS